MIIREILKKCSKIIAFLLVLALAILIYINGERNAEEYRKKISANPTLTNGVVTNLEFRIKHGYQIDYEFFVEGVKRAGSLSSSRYESIKNELIGKSFPVIFKSDDPSFSEILVFPEDFERYKLSFPDSLRWVRGR